MCATEHYFVIKKTYKLKTVLHLIALECKKRRSAWRILRVGVTHFFWWKTIYATNIHTSSSVAYSF